jgi:heme o synthase
MTMALRHGLGETEGGLACARSYLCLCKTKISFFAALSAAAGFLLSTRPFGVTLLTVFAGVFLAACGACALNHCQEQSTDALMPRTAQRPIPAGKIKLGRALRLSLTLIVTGLFVLLTTGVPAAPLAGLFAVSWYNGFYTWLKTKTAFAVIPGALVGAVAPAIGWLAAGESPLDPRLAALSFFFFIWQVPHFFIHLHAFGKEYEEAGLPTLTSVFTGAQLDRLTFQWILATAVGLQLIGTFGLIRSPLVHFLILAVSLWFAYEGINFMIKQNQAYSSIFTRTNYLMLMVMLLIFADNLLHFAP